MMVEFIFGFDPPGLTPGQAPRKRLQTACNSNPVASNWLVLTVFFCWEKTQPMEEVEKLIVKLIETRKNLYCSDWLWLKTIELGGSGSITGFWTLPRLHSWGLHDPRSQTTCWSAWWPGRTDGWWISASTKIPAFCGQDEWVRVQD